MSDRNTPKDLGKTSEALGEAARRGFYATHFRPDERAALEACGGQGLLDEIVMLRVVIRRLLGLSQGIEAADEMIDVLRALGMASTRLSQLLLAQQELGKDSSPFGPLISKGLAEVVEELGIRGP